MHFSGGKERYTDNCSMLQVQIIHPILLSRDGCYTLSVIKPCYSVESTGNSSKFQGNPEVTPTQPATTSEKAKLHVGSSVHCGNEGTETVKWTDSKKTQHQQWMRHKELH